MALEKDCDNIFINIASSSTTLVGVDEEMGISISDSKVILLCDTCEDLTAD
jgi:hypothetical protein